ncbi:hypothetical protein QMO56_20570 [Roseomonas sp. E05]|uniref:F0F1 ATP synthase subunit B family protein n=1 Tax=Roseomonas sp. E05 TaxID=3046310 RepID=UPI0024B8D031|nr:hypothetical protein [Roseomonas sp. E05]MDJ0390510.1 hypothetical protein [Roseomonas sp. E05]
MRIDWWTLGLQTVNVLVLIWLLQHFLFKPVKAVIEARRVAAGRVLEEAEADRARAQAEAATLEARRRDFAAEGEKILAEARAAATAERDALLAEARQEAARLEAEARATLGREREAMRQALEAQAGELAVTIARRLLALLPPAQVTAALLEALVQETTRLPPEARRDLAAAPEPVVVATATPLSPAEQEAWRARLRQAVGGGADFAFRHEPALIAGGELQGPHTLVRRSWRADLDRLAHALTLAPQAGDVHQLA